MDIKKIKQIVSLDLDDQLLKHLIIQHLAVDKDVIPTILAILNEERVQNKELLLDTNARLSMTFVALRDYVEAKRTTKSVKELGAFVLSSVIEHYHKWQDVISCNLNLKGMPDYKE